MQAWLASGHCVCPAGQQLSTPPQPSGAWPQVYPRAAQVVAVHVGAPPHSFGAVAPHQLPPVHVTPPLPELQV